VGIDEKNLGLVPAPDHEQAAAIIASSLAMLKNSCDLSTLFETQSADAIATPATPPTVRKSANKPSLKVGIAKDKAFHFYYQDDLDYLSSMGVELTEVSPLADAFPTDLDGFIIGGGFPERHAQALAENSVFLEGLSNQINMGLPVHAECAGLMYLCNRLVTEQGQSWPMAGVINATATMRERPIGRGYMELVRLNGDNESHRTHEFHHSEIAFDSPPDFVYRVKRGYGIDGKHDGVRVSRSSDHPPAGAQLLCSKSLRPQVLNVNAACSSKTLTICHYGLPHSDQRMDRFSIKWGSMIQIQETPWWRVGESTWSLPKNTCRC